MKHSNHDHRTMDFFVLNKRASHVCMCAYVYMCMLCATSKSCTNWAISLSLAYILKGMANRAAKHTLVIIKWRTLKCSVDQLLGSALNLFGET